MGCSVLSSSLARSLSPDCEVDVVQFLRDKAAEAPESLREEVARPLGSRGSGIHRLARGRNLLNWERLVPGSLLYAALFCGFALLLLPLVAPGAFGPHLHEDLAALWDEASVVLKFLELRLHWAS